MASDPASEERPLQHKGILITGGSTGIGKAVAVACIIAGADVTICARTITDLAETENELKALAGTEQRLLSVAADVSDESAVRDLVNAAAVRMRYFTGVVNCAAVLGPKGALDEVSFEEWTATVQTNLIGTVMVCACALPHFRRQGYGKIVNFSGGGATSPRPRFSAYAASKAAVVRLSENLAHELAGTGIDVNALAPGAVNTRMLKEVLEAGPERVGQAIYEEALNQRERGGAPAVRAAELCVKLLSAESDGLTGRLISAIWDPWETLGSWKNQVAASDVYTLRRIAPEDRGLTLK